MKKGLAVLLAVLLAMAMATVGVSAEGFTFRETSRLQVAPSVVLLTWNMIEAPSGTRVNKVVIGDKECSFVDGEEQPNMLTVSLTGVPAGIYTSVEYGYTVDGAQEFDIMVGSQIVAEGRLKVTLTASFNAEGTLTVKAADANGKPVPDYQVSLTLEGMPEAGKTNDKGVYTSTYRVSEGKSATFEGVETAYRDTTLIYEASAKQSLSRPLPTTTTVATTTVETTTTESEETTTTESEGTTTTEGGETTTTEQQVDATTGTTALMTAIVKGDSTTALANGMVAANALTDTALLESFGMTRQEFLTKARLLVSEADYQLLVGRTGNIPMLNVRTSTTEITLGMLQSALTNVSDFSSYAEDQRQMQTFDLSLLMFSRTGKEVPVTALPDGVIYTIQLPIPTAMKKCTAFAITVMDGDELMAPQKLEVKNGMFELKINSLEAYTLIGFGEENQETAGGFSWRLIALLIAGILLIAGAGVLLYFFVFRKPDEIDEFGEESAEKDAFEDNDTDIFSGRTDIENTWEPEDN